MTAAHDLRQPLHAYLANKGELSALLAVVCVAAWLEETRGPGPFTTRDVAQLYPRRDRPAGVPALASPADALRRAARRELLACVARAADGRRETWYVLTDLGRAAVAALPDLREVSDVRGLRRAMPGVRRATE